MSPHALYSWSKAARLVRWVQALSVMLLSGCLVGPSYRTPKAGVNNQWIEEAPAGVQREARVDIERWKVFDDPVLNNLVETAYRENLTLQIAAMRVLGSMAQRGVAVGTTRYSPSN